MVTAGSLTFLEEDIQTLHLQLGHPNKNKNQGNAYSLF